MIIGRKIEVTVPLWKGEKVEKWEVYTAWVLDAFNGYIQEHGQKVKAYVYLVMIDDGTGRTKICNPENVNRIIDVETLQKKLAL